MSALAALARLESLSPRGMKLGLAAIGAVCERLGRPERRVASVLIAGTNGKGSTAATLASIAAASGIRAGLYTSPHLIHVTERIRIGERDIAPQELEAALAHVFAVADAAPPIPLTYFEAMTAAAFLLFAERSLDLAILEVGLGGRFDATNVAPAEVSVVTSISLDHVEELGSTVDSIAREKAGIFRTGKPALVWGEASPALDVFRAEAGRVGALLQVLAKDDVNWDSAGLEGERFGLRTPMRGHTLFTPLPGAHQAWNAAIAARAAELLSEDFPGITGDTIAAGVRGVRWPGRLERFRVGSRTVLLDGCHNPGGATCLAAFLNETGLGRRSYLVFGAMADKNVEAMARVLFPAVKGVLLTSPRCPRAATPQELQERLAGFRGNLRACDQLETALREALSDPNADPIIVAGSLYLVGEARAWLLAKTMEERTS